MTACIRGCCNLGRSRVAAVPTGLAGARAAVILGFECLSHVPNESRPRASSGGDATRSRWRDRRSASEEDLASRCKSSGEEEEAHRCTGSDGHLLAHEMTFGVAATQRGKPFHQRCFYLSIGALSRF